jgi:hypothetical protein
MGLNLSEPGSNRTFFGRARQAGGEPLSYNFLFFIFEMKKCQSRRQKKVVYPACCAPLVE